MTNVASVNVAEIMGRKESIDAMEKLQAAFEANPAAMKVLDAVESVEDAYNVAKEFFSIQLDEFKILFDKTVEYFKSPKARLEDDMLECVAAGYSFREFWKDAKQRIVVGAIITGCTAAGIIGGALVGGPAGAFFGGCAAATAGVATAAGVASKMDD